MVYENKIKLRFFILTSEKQFENYLKIQNMIFFFILKKKQKWYCKAKQRFFNEYTHMCTILLKCKLKNKIDKRIYNRNVIIRIFKYGKLQVVFLIYFVWSFFNLKKTIVLYLFNSWPTNYVGFRLKYQKQISIQVRKF